MAAAPPGPPSAPPAAPAAAPPPAADTLAAALAGHAARHPHRPFLFWPDGLDWRWMDYAEAAGEVARLERAGPPAEGLDEGAVTAGAGEAAVPDAVGEALEAVAGPRPAGGSPAFLEIAALGARAQAAAAAAFGAGLALAAPRRPRREIVVLAPPFAEERGADPGASLLFAWAVLAGAALVLEPSPPALVATAAWARPTLFRGPAADLAALAREAEAAERHGFSPWLRRLRHHLAPEAPPPLPFARLHTLLLAGPPPPAESLTFWHTRGTRVLPDPASQ
jgi:hypothetical protein